MDGRMGMVVQERIPHIGNIRVTRSLPSAVTTEWKVRWTADMISRDLLQNFRDASKGNLRQVRIQVPARDCVMIHGKEEFNIERLYYIGSEKSAGAGDVGGFGEGFKAAAVALLRDFGVTPIVVSGATGVAISIAEKAVPGTDLKPLCYHFFEHDGAVSGTYLLLVGANNELASAVKNGRDWYFDERHPAVAGPCIYENDVVALYATKRNEGLGFYCGHLRMRLNDLPIIINYKSPEAKVDALVSSDRDRRMFEGKAADRYFMAISKGLSIGGRKALLAATKKTWRHGKGHPMLEAIAAATRGSAQQEAMRESIGQDIDAFFVRGWQASYGPSDPLTQQENEWSAAGQIRLPNYFETFGVKSIATVLHERSHKERLERENERKQEEARLRQKTEQHKREQLEAQLIARVSAADRNNRDVLMKLGRLLIQGGMWGGAILTLDVKVIEFCPIDTHHASVTSRNGILLVESAKLKKPFSEVVTWMIIMIEHSLVTGWTRSVFGPETTRQLMLSVFSRLPELAQLEQQWRTGS